MAVPSPTIAAMIPCHMRDHATIPTRDHKMNTIKTLMASRVRDCTVIPMTGQVRGYMVNHMKDHTGLMKGTGAIFLQPLQ